MRAACSSPLLLEPAEGVAEGVGGSQTQHTTFFAWRKHGRRCPRSPKARLARPAHPAILPEFTGMHGLMGRRDQGDAASAHHAAGQRRQGRQSKAGGAFKCPRCAATTVTRGGMFGTNGHFRQYIVKRNGHPDEKKQLCIVMDKAAIGAIRRVGLSEVEGRVQQTLSRLARPLPVAIIVAGGEVTASGTVTCNDAVGNAAASGAAASGAGAGEPLLDDLHGVDGVDQFGWAPGPRDYVEAPAHVRLSFCCIPLSSGETV